MKRLLLLISFAIFFLNSFTQIDVQRDNRVSPVLKLALASKSGYYIYGRTGAAGFINIAVLNQSSNTLCWFTCHGRLFDSTKLTDQEVKQVTSKQIEPFVLYQNICNKYLADIAAAKDIYRVYGDIQLIDKLNGNYRALFAMETVQSAQTPLQKLIAIENVRKKILTQLAYLNCVSPFGLLDDPLYKISKEQAGAMIQTKDSTVYYNIDPTSAVAKISLYKKSAGQLYIQNRFSEIIDSVAIQPEKYDLLHKEKTDVFLLYRGWLELQWQGALAALKRQSSWLYSQVNAQNEKEVKELYSQLNAIVAKINQLNSPEAKSIEQAVYATYKNETSEISYIPLLGMGYTFTQTRGQKEYELTNHLGNVLVTVTDKKNGVSSTSDSSLIDHYEPDIVSAQDYYPFGMLQPGRSYLSSTGSKYRYGFNGKENDSEVKGEGNQQDYGMRIYDPRIAKFLSEDPITKKYPELTPYQFASNRPIDGVDEDGLEWAYVDKFNVPLVVNKETTDKDKLQIAGVKWVGYDLAWGKPVPKAGSISKAYTFGSLGMTTFGVDAKGEPTKTWQSYSSLSTGSASTDRKLGTLHSSLQNQMKSFILKAQYRFGIDLRVSDGFRTVEQQDVLYAQGRTQGQVDAEKIRRGITRTILVNPENKGGIITKAIGGYSNHNFGLAIDVVPEENGQLNWNTTKYPMIGLIGESRGLEWGGRWRTMPDAPHFQNLWGYSLGRLRRAPKDGDGLPILNFQRQ